MLFLSIAFTVVRNYVALQVNLNSNIACAYSQNDFTMPTIFCVGCVAGVFVATPCVVLANEERGRATHIRFLSEKLIFSYLSYYYHPRSVDLGRNGKEKISE